MTKHILLINPWIHDFAAFDLWLKPLGLLYIGAVLEKSGYKVSLVNCLERPALSGANVSDSQGKDKEYGCGKFFSQEVEKPPFFRHIPRRFKRYSIAPEIFRQKLLSLPEPDAICVTSAMTYWYPGVFEAIKISKSLYPTVPIILGGIYATLCYEHAMKHSGADYVIKGTGELAVLRLVDQICGVKSSEFGVRSFGKNHDYEFITNDLRPAYNLFKNLVSVSMLTSRGCPFSCTYCASRLLQSTFKRRHPEKVVLEIEHYVNNLGVKDIAFYDDALLINPQAHIIPILKMIIEKGITVRFHTPNGLHLKYIDIQLARLLKMANFKTIRLGFESANARRQNDSDNKTTNVQLAEALNNLRSAGFDSKEIGVYIMMGLPDETYEEIVESMLFVNKCGGRIKAAQYSPIPGTLDFEKASKKYPLLKDEPLLHNNSAYPLANESLDFNKYEKLKEFARTLNASII